MIARKPPSRTLTFGKSTFTLNPRVCLALSKQAVSNARKLARTIKDSDDPLADLEAGHVELDLLLALPDALDAFAKDMSAAADVLAGEQIEGTPGELTDLALTVKAQTDGLRAAAPDIDIVDTQTVQDGLRAAAKALNEASGTVTTRIGQVDRDLRLATGLAMTEKHLDPLEVMEKYEVPKHWPEFEPVTPEIEHPADIMTRLDPTYRKEVRAWAEEQVLEQMRKHARLCLHNDGKAVEGERERKASIRRKALQKQAAEVWANV
ncbi:hypothetical protein [Sulfitobacter sp. JL08]|uniref:hypothetical protein n=1 Tax=Sulfitobacter sp. JL08 TaxID=2070369 RepID=UPI0013B47687|nr:hypothetical protein [Sulfitobacter sp. JL08]